MISAPAPECAELDEERVSIRIREYRAFRPDCRTAGVARMVGACVAFGSQGALIATESDEVFIAYRRLIFNELMVKKQ